MNLLLRFCRSGVAFALAVLLVACVSTTFRVEPETEQAGLAVGRIVLDAKGFTGRPFSMTGRYTELNGLELIFRDSLGQETTVRSRNGYFFLYADVGGEPQGIQSVRLTRLYYRRSASNGWRTIETWIEAGSEYVHLKPGTVTNLGTLQWTAWGDHSTPWRVQYSGPDDLEAWFRDRFVDSGWLVANWENGRPLAASARLRWEWYYEYH